MKIETVNSLYEGLLQAGINSLLILSIVIFIIMPLLGFKVMYVATKSMEPTIKAGQFVLGVKASGSLVEGDIATYKSENGLITHRVIAAYENHYEFKGDNNETSDGYVYKDQIVYKIISY